MMKKSLIITLLLLFLASVAHAQFVVPTTGRVTSGVGLREHPTQGGTKHHDGIDFAPAPGTRPPVLATYEGVARVGDQGNAGWGKYVYIEHPNGLVSVYGHLSEVHVTNGQRVSTGAQIGKVGSTGDSTGNHLHFEINVGGLKGENYAPNGTYWDKAAGFNIGKTLTAGTTFAVEGASASESVVAPGGSSYDPCLETIPIACEAEGGEAEPSALEAALTPKAGVDDLPEVTERFDYGNIDIDGSGIDPDDIDPDDPNAPKPFLPTPKEWINATVGLMDQPDVDLASNFNKLGMALLFAFFVWSLLNITYYYQSDQYLNLFGRLIIASGLIFAAPVISKTTLTTWEATYNQMTERIVEPATTELEGQLGELGPSLRNLAILTATLKTLGGLVPDVVPGGELIDELSGASGGLTKGLYGIMITMGSLYGIYLLAIYLSAMTVILAGVLLPILAAFLMLPGSGDWFNRWMSMVVLAFITTVAFSFIFSVVVTVGVNQPMKLVIEISQDMEAQMAVVQTAMGDIPGSREGFLRKLNWFTGPAWISYTTNLRAVTGAAAANMTRLMVQWMFSLVFLIIAVLSSIYIMQQLPGLLQGFIGGVTGRAAGAASGGGAFLGGVAGGALGAAGAAGATARAPIASGGKALAGGARGLSNKIGELENEARRQSKIRKTKPQMAALQQEIDSKDNGGGDRGSSGDQKLLPPAKG